MAFKVTNFPAVFSVCNGFKSHSSLPLSADMIISVVLISLPLSVWFKVTDLQLLKDQDFSAIISVCNDLKVTDFSAT